MFFGILGLCYFLNAIILCTRIRYFDRLYGNNSVLSFRTLMSAVAFVLILFHRQFKISGGELVPTGQILIAKIALVLFAAATGTTVLIIVRKLIHELKFFRRIRVWMTSHAVADYSKLKILHNLLPLAAIAAVIHVMQASAIVGHSGRTAFIGVYAFSAAFLYIRFKFIQPMKLGKHKFTITEIRNPGADITEVRMSGRQIKFKAGQYAYWRLYSRAVGSEEHPFTISSSPGEDEIGFSAKAVGDYTAALSRLRLGEEAVIDGPYGNFVLPPDDTTPVLLIAGGIGITPFRSMVQNMADSHSLRQATLIWGVKNRDKLIYGGEFFQLAKRLPSFRYKPVIENQDELVGDGTLADFESGYVTKGLIRGLCPDLASSDSMVYICGPDPMRKAVVKILKSIGVPRRRINFERFSPG